MFYKFLNFRKPIKQHIIFITKKAPQLRGFEIFFLLNFYCLVVNDLTADHGPVPAALTALTLQKYAVRDPS
jgi:hypothetical protein